MCLLRFLALSLMISACVVPVAAQSSNKTPTLPQNRLDEIAPLQFTGNVPLFSEGQSNILGNQFQNTFQPSRDFPRNLITLAPNNSLCYSMRSYGLTRINPASDVTRMSSYSTCQPSTQFEVKLLKNPYLNSSH